ncbi:MAG: NAD(P)-dependent oxidoreductase [bacterium]|nr:NAD(P)-dependent oxidoreductase [bacterium]
MKRIGFIGVGIMGKSMVRNLMKAGYEVSIYARTKGKVLDIIEEGAIWCDSIAECSKGQDAVITIVGYPKDVEEVYFAETGILANADQGTYVIDMTTSTPKLAAKIYKEAKEKDIFSLDAPVTGGDTGAKAGTLAILVGGDKEAFEACHQVFEAMGKNIVYMGEAGMGQHAKMANQIAIAGTIAGVTECLVYAKKVGLSPETLFGAISTGAAGSFQMTNVVPRVLEGDLNPGFFIKHFIKDMAIASEEAKDHEASLEILDHVLRIYKDLEEKNLGDLGTQGLIKHYEE